MTEDKEADVSTVLDHANLIRALYIKRHCLLLLKGILVWLCTLLNEEYLTLLKHTPKKHRPASGRLRFESRVYCLPAAEKQANVFIPGRLIHSLGFRLSWDLRALPWGLHVTHVTDSIHTVHSARMGWRSSARGDLVPREHLRISKDIYRYWNQNRWTIGV